MWWVPCKWRRIFLSVKALDSAKAWNEMREQIKECVHTHRSSFKQISKQKICHFHSFNTHRFTVCYPALCIRAATDYLSVMRHYLCTKMCGRASHPHIQCSQRHLQDAIRSTYTMQWIIVCSGAHVHYTDCNKHLVAFVHWNCLLPVQCRLHY